MDMLNLEKFGSVTELWPGNTNKIEKHNENIMFAFVLLFERERP